MMKFHYYSITISTSHFFDSLQKDLQDRHDSTTMSTSYFFISPFYHHLDTSTP